VYGVMGRTVVYNTRRDPSKEQWAYITKRLEQYAASIGAIDA
jgi:hypothetical protein